MFSFVNKIGFNNGSKVGSPTQVEFKLMLSLVNQTWLKICYTDHVFHFIVLNVCWINGKDDCLLNIQVDIFHYNFLMFNTFSYKVNTNVNMFALTMKHNIFHQVNFKLITDIQNDRHDMMFDELFHDIFKPNV